MKEELNMEIWKPVKDFEGLYEVSNLGKVKTLRENRLLKPVYNKQNGYRYVRLYNKCEKFYYIHQLVAEMFCGKPTTNLRLTVNHKNGRKLDNRANNLEWVTFSQNLKHAYDNNLKQLPKTTRKVHCVELNKDFSSPYKAALYLIQTEHLTAKYRGIANNINRVCKKERNTAYKYHWHFV